jgi:hypothetical protein
VDLVARFYVAASATPIQRSTEAPFPSGSSLNRAPANDSAMYQHFFLTRYLKHEALAFDASRRGAGQCQDGLPCCRITKAPNNAIEVSQSNAPPPPDLAGEGVGGA